MSNEYGKIYKRVWGDRDFKSLSEGEQALYQKLCSQPDVSLAGVLTYAPQRWASQTAGLTVGCIEKRFAGLLAKRYLLWDDETQEVLIRSYVRNDLGWKSPRTMIGIALAVRRVLSEKLSGAIAEELKRLDMDILSDVVSPKTGRSTRQVVEPLVECLISEFQGLDTPSDGVSDGVSHTPSDGVSDGVSATRLQQLQQQTQEQEQTQEHHSPSIPSAADTPRESDDEELLIIETPDQPDPFEEWWNTYGYKADRKKAEAKYRLIIRKKEATPELLLETASRYVENLKARGKFPEYAKRPLTWLNGECWNDEVDTPQPEPADRYEPRQPTPEQQARIDEARARHEQRLRDAETERANELPTTQAERDAAAAKLREVIGL